MCPDARRARCWNCEGHRDDVGSISWTGLCRDCGKARGEANYDAMKTKRGPFAQWWAVKVAASVGFAPLDDLPPRP